MNRSIPAVAFSLALALILGCRASEDGPTTSVDGGIPTCTLTAPAPFATGLTGAILLTATAADDVGVAGVDFQFDGADLATVTSSPYQTTLPNTAAYASGQHVFRARSRDAAGNSSPWSQTVVSFGGAVALPSGFNLGSVTTSLTNATAMTVAPDGRVFVCEQGGALRIVKAGSLLSTPFATLTTTATGERGLLGVALDPAFPSNGYVYVYYTAATPTTHNRVSRLTADIGNPDVAMPGSESALIDLPTLSATNHNGGALQFGPDGKLYVATGENAVPANAPLLTTTLGKILRFNADASIPSDNPFVASTIGLNQAIWAKGLRNPFSFAFQPGTTLMHINDVGQSTWEEVDTGAAGADYGWPSTEGPTSAAGITAPRFAYGHPSAPAGQPGSTGTFLQGLAIVGAAFDAAASPWPAGYHGCYWFGDLTGGWVARMHLASGSVSTFATGFSGLRALAFAGDGSLYVLTASTLQKITHP